MAATEVIYASGSLDLPALCLDQGATIRRQIANLGNNWTKIGIAFAMRAVGTSTLASAAASETLTADAPAKRFAFGLKNNDGTLYGQAGCKFIGIGSNNLGSNTSSVYSASGTGRLTTAGETMSAVVQDGANEAETEVTKDTSTLPSIPQSTGTEATTNFTRIFALTIEIKNRGTVSQAIAIKYASANAASVITQAALESAILNVNQSISDVACSSATYDLSDIDCVFIQWPFANNRLLVFGPTSGAVGSPFVMRLS